MPISRLRSLLSCLAPLVGSASLASAQAIAFHEDFEAGGAAWTTTGLWNLEPSFSSCSDPISPYPAGSWAMWYGDPLGHPSCNYNVGSTSGSLSMTTAVHLPATWGFASLRFWTFEEVELSSGVDLRLIQVSVDGGQTWSLVGQCEASFWDGWYQKRVGLDAFLGQDIQLRFLFDSVDDFANEYLGWWIDELWIEEACTPVTETYCLPGHGSTGSYTQIQWTGVPELFGNSFYLVVQGATPEQPGLFFYGADQTQQAMGSSWRCVSAGALGTFVLGPPARTSPSGAMTRHLDFTAQPAASGAGAILPGSTWYFQFWYRDPMASNGTSFNLSDGLRVSACP